MRSKIYGLYIVKVKYTLAFDITITSALVCVPASRFIRQLKKL